MAAPLLGLRVRILPGARKYVCCECRVLSGRSLSGGLITRPEDSYSVWRVFKNAIVKTQPWPTSDCYGRRGEKKITINMNYFPNSIHQTIFLIKTFCVLCSAGAEVVYVSLMNVFLQSASCTETLCCLPPDVLRTNSGFVQIFIYIK